MFVDLKPVRCTNFSNRINAAVSNKGEIFVEYTDFPCTDRARVMRLLEKAVGLFGGDVLVGGWEEKILGVCTRSGNTGLFIVSGESLPCALEEKGINIDTKTIASAINFKELEPAAPVGGEVFLV